jgi:hypothetical protein
MNTTAWRAFCAGCVLVGALCGCAAPSASSDASTREAKAELRQLKFAYDMGNISREDYEQRRALIISKHPDSWALAPGTPLNESVRSTLKQP